MRFSYENIDSTFFIFIDIQDKLVSMVPDKIQQVLEKNVTLLKECADVFNIDTIITEQYPDGLGKTHSCLPCSQENNVIEKLHFNCNNDTEFCESINSEKKTIYVLSGIETHICVFQTAIDLLNQNYEVIIVIDAVASRKKLHWKTALSTLQNKGAILLPAESVVFLLLQKAGTKEFKHLSRLIK